MPWLMMDTRLPNPYYQEQYDLWGLNDTHPTFVVLDTNGIIRYRATGNGGVNENEINYRYAFNFTAELLQEAKAQAQVEQADTVSEGWAVGQRAFDFTLSDLDENEYTLSDYFGKTILLTFWGTGCIDCGDLVPGLYAQEIWERYGRPDNLIILGVDHHTPHDFLASFVKDMGLEYPVTVDPKGTIFSTYRILDEFIYIVIDSDGIIRYRGHELDDDVFDVLTELIGPPVEPL